MRQNVFMPLAAHFQSPDPADTQDLARSASVFFLAHPMGFINYRGSQTITGKHLAGKPREACNPDQLKPLPGSCFRPGAMC